ncbi:helix-turn-helix domain-containing protein [Nonomuraea helvata]|uniref:GbsR/MarR family transcriptional regulator n=1 Tax=Nonomuraea helvata TaxID=37484 RepID=UPI0031EF69EB
MQEEAVEMAVGMGLPKMMARVLIGLWLSEDGRLTAAELSRGLNVSPASISMAVGYLTQQGLIRRERDPQRRHDIYVVDDDACTTRR